MFVVVEHLFMYGFNNLWLFLNWRRLNHKGLADLLLQLVHAVESFVQIRKTTSRIRFHLC